MYCIHVPALVGEMVTCISIIIPIIHHYSLNRHTKFFCDFYAYVESTEYKINL